MRSSMKPSWTRTQQVANYPTSCFPGNWEVSNGEKILQPSRVWAPGAGLSCPHLTPTLNSHRIPPGIHTRFPCPRSSVQGLIAENWDPHLAFHSRWIKAPVPLSASPLPCVHPFPHYRALNVQDHLFCNVVLNPFETLQLPGSHSLLPDRWPSTWLDLDSLFPCCQSPRQLQLLCIRALPSALFIRAKSQSAANFRGSNL